jgi:hypothetical protein
MAASHAGNCRGDGNDYMQIGMPILQTRNRLGKDREDAPHFARTAARYDAEHQRVVGEVVFPSKDFAVTGGGRLDCRVADIGAGNTVVGKERDLERQERHEVVHPLAARPARQAQACGAT